MKKWMLDNILIIMLLRCYTAPLVQEKDVCYICMSLEVKAHQAEVLSISNVRRNKTKPIQSDECAVTVLESCISFSQIHLINIPQGL